MVSLKSNESIVHIGNDVLGELNKFLANHPSTQRFILVDENTLEDCLPELMFSTKGLEQAEIIEINSGEENKTLDICYQLWKTLIEFNADRGALLINLGGGVITDMGGFVASTYKRGIDFVNIPTSLLAQIDASVGGKVGVDLEGFKNMVGVFQEPLGVFVYPSFLKTLDKRQMISGYAEALKHGLIQDKSYWNALKDGMLSDSDKWEVLIVKSVAIKNEIVKADPTEKGERKLLNFGHTIGHAIESDALLNSEWPLLHGEAIAIGMICESYISHKVTGLSHEALDEISQTIRLLYNDHPIDVSNSHRFIELMGNDKKNKGSEINFTLLAGIGKGVIDQTVSTDLILASFEYYASLCKSKVE